MTLPVEPEVMVLLQELLRRGHGGLLVIVKDNMVERVDMTYQWKPVRTAGLTKSKKGAT